MGTFFSYNGYTHDENACWFEIDRYGIVGPTGRIIKTRNIWTIHGRVNSSASPGAPSSAAIASVNSKVAAWENKLKDGGDVIFSLGDSMKLLDADCVEGTHLKSFSWLPGYDGVRGSGAEGVLRRTFKLVVYGDIAVTNTDTDIMEWQETISYTGTGLAKVVPVGSLAGTVQAQVLQQYTPYWITQSGHAVGLTNYPYAPTPIFQGFTTGVYYTPDGVSTSKMTPRKYGKNKNLEFPIRWNYRAWSSFGGSSFNPTNF